MLFKNLKLIINESDGETEMPIEPEVSTVSNKPQKDVNHINNASDGIGNEIYDIANQMGNTLKKGLMALYNISKIHVSDNVITITADISKMKNNMITSKKTGSSISTETLLSTISFMVAAALGTNSDEFGLESLESAPGIIIVTIKSKS